MSNLEEPRTAAGRDLFTNLAESPMDGLLWGHDYELDVPRLKEAILVIEDEAQRDTVERVTPGFMRVQMRYCIGHHPGLMCHPDHGCPEFLAASIQDIAADDLATPFVEVARSTGSLKILRSRGPSSFPGDDVVDSISPTHAAFQLYLTLVVVPDKDEPLQYPPLSTMNVHETGVLIPLSVP